MTGYAVFGSGPPIFQAPESILDNVRCPICYEVCEDAMCCPTGHHFCKVCIKTWLRRRETCPCTNTFLCSSALRADLVTRAKVENLVAKCCEPCDWIGPLSDREAHLRSECVFTMYECKNRGCSERFTLSGRAAHEATCAHRLVDCQNAGCRAKLRVGTQDSHDATTCRFASVECEFPCCVDRAGNRLRIMRGELSEHYSNARDRHISYITNASREIRDEEGRLQLALSRLRGRGRALSRLRSRVSRSGFGSGGGGGAGGNNGNSSNSANASLPRSSLAVLTGGVRSFDLRSGGGNAAVSNVVGLVSTDDSGNDSGVGAGDPGSTGVSVPGGGSGGGAAMALRLMAGEDVFRLMFGGDELVRSDYLRDVFGETDI